MFGCSWKVVSAKFQQINTTKITFVADSEDEEVNDNNEDEEDDDDISVDNEVLAKISQKNPDKKTLVEKKAAPVPVPAPATLKKKAMPAPIPQEEEDDDEEDADEDADEDAADDVVVGNALGDVAEEEEDDDDDDDDDEEEDVPPPPPVKVVEPVKTEAKAKKTVAKKGK
jgi:hypothetical protein